MGGRRGPLKLFKIRKIWLKRRSGKEMEVAYANATYSINLITQIIIQEKR